MVFFFVSVYVVDYIYKLPYVEPALHPWDESYLVVMDNLFDVLLHSVGQYFIEDFYICVHHGYWPEVFLFVESLPGFGIRMMLVSENDLGRIPSFCIVWNGFRRNVTSSSLYVW